MRPSLWTAFVVALAVPFSGRGDRPEPLRSAVAELDVRGLDLKPVRGALRKPDEIPSAAALARTCPGEEDQARIRKQVDFATQKLLFFAWSGSGQDQLRFKAGAGERPEIRFIYEPGRTRDLRPHFHLYVVPRDAPWNIGR